MRAHIFDIMPVRGVLAALGALLEYFLGLSLRALTLPLAVVVSCCRVREYPVGWVRAPPRLCLATFLDDIVPGYWPSRGCFLGISVREETVREALPKVMECQKELYKTLTNLNLDIQNAVGTESGIRSRRMKEQSRSMTTPKMNQAAHDNQPRDPDITTITNHTLRRRLGFQGATRRRRQQPWITSHNPRGALRSNESGFPTSLAIELTQNDERKIT